MQLPSGFIGRKKNNNVFNKKMATKASLSFIRVTKNFNLSVFCISFFFLFLLNKICTLIFSCFSTTNLNLIYEYLSNLCRLSCSGCRHVSLIYNLPTGCLSPVLGRSGEVSPPAINPYSAEIFT